jgi:hypothetical protein
MAFSWDSAKASELVQAIEERRWDLALVLAPLAADSLGEAVKLNPFKVVKRIH